MESGKLRNMIFGSQCKNCNGFPTDLRVFDNARALFMKCSCGKHEPVDAIQFADMVAYHERIEDANA